MNGWTTKQKKIERVAEERFHKRCQEMQADVHPAHQGYIGDIDIDGRVCLDGWFSPGTLREVAAAADAYVSELPLKNIASPPSPPGAPG